MTAPTKHPVYDLSLTPDGRVFNSRGREVSGSRDKNGYVRIVVSRGSRRSLHVLLLETFVGPRPSPLHQGRHMDDNNANNELSNLAWGTPKQNCEDRARNGRTACGEAHYRAKLNAQQIEEIRSRAAPRNHAALGREYGVSGVLIGLIVKGKVWKNAA